MNVYEKLADPLAFAVFLLTLFLPVIIGFLALRRTSGQSDFFVGGRAMNRIVVALSAVSSGRSSWLVLGVSGMAYEMGASAVWAIVGYTAVEAVQFVTIGKRLRERTQAYGSITLLDYLESRFEDSAHVLRIAGSLIIAVFITAYVAAQFNAGAKTLATALEIPFGGALIVSGLLILAYMVVGGYVAVAYNDVVRAVIMLGGLVILPVVALVELGGPGILVETLSRLDPRYVDPLSLGLGGAIGFLGIGLGSPGQPHIVVRYMSVDDPGNLTVSAIVGTAWNVILGLGAVSIGLLGRALVPDAGGLPDGDPEMIYLVLSSSHFGPVLYGLLVGGVIAAILSTADSQLLVVASTFARDVYEKMLARREEKDEKRRLLLSRIVVVLAGVLAILLAFTAKDLVFWLVLFAWGGLGASLGPAVIFSLYWKRTTRLGVLAGMVTGTAVTIAWKLLLREPTGIYELIPAFFSSAFAVVTVSLLQKPRSTTLRSGSSRPGGS
jgi:sodium/proline symporter